MSWRLAPSQNVDHFFFKSLSFRLYRRKCKDTALAYFIALKFDSFTDEHLLLIIQIMTAFVSTKATKCAIFRNHTMSRNFGWTIFHQGTNPSRELRISCRLSKSLICRHPPRRNLFRELKYFFRQLRGHCEYK